MVTRQAVISQATAVSTAAEAGVVAAVLRALASMARISQRHQAEVDAALHRAGVTIGADTVAGILRQLGDQGCVDGLIPLSDGALLLTVTALGMSRSGIG